MKIKKLYLKIFYYKGSIAIENPKICIRCDTFISDCFKCTSNTTCK